ncbi:major facilitator superfamily domain-containing protein [Microdochium trichocladiopsis]|uniref:Major facilitator superfamily domain-containing protein n=1 Tax=Microdochium trichocladiopsis TaxID=1682393 RepID=A0A9P9BJE0_9PEZI|nr:major facilitator superfamily domain-containing protein [Microdochium trichocladiopsis]KAH7025133.1 major facilitator superfamily domain-containing protein [Microdochium trichocladiopsis]
MDSSEAPSTTRSSTDIEKNAQAEGQASGTDSLSPQTEPKEEVQQATALQLVLVMTVAITSVLVIGLDQTIVATAIPRITDEFKGLDKVSWYGSSYFLTSAAMTPAWGKLFRYIPLKTAYLAAFFVFELGSLICGVAPNADALIVGRAIAGLGVGGMLTGCLMMITYAMPPATRPMGFSSVVTGYGIAAALGPLIGGAFTEHVSWRWCFYINLPIGVLTLAAIIFVPKLEAAKTQPATIKEIILQLDLVGASLLMGAIVAIILALQYAGQTLPWGSATVIGLLVGFFLIIAAFCAWQVYLGEKAVLVPRLMKTYPLWANATWQFFFSGAYFISLYYLPLYFQSVSGVSPGESGVRNLPLVLAVCLVSIPAGKVQGMWPSSIVWFKTLFGALVIITCALFYTMDENTSTGQWIGFQILGGAAWASAWQCAMLTVQRDQEPADLPIATSTISLTQFLGGAIGVSIAQMLFNNRLLSSLAESAPDIDTAVVLHTGATELRNVFSPEDVPRVVSAYLAGLHWVWIFVTVFASIGWVLSLLDYVYMRDLLRAPAGGKESGKSAEPVIAH